MKKVVICIVSIVSWYKPIYGQSKWNVSALDSLTINQIFKQYEFLKNNRGFALDKDTCETAVTKLNQDINKMFNSILRQKSYPGYSSIGKIGSEQLVVLLKVSHSNNERKRLILALMYKQVIQKNAPSEPYAIIVDKISMDEKKKQIYGTIVSALNLYYKAKIDTLTLRPKPIIDSINVDKRRLIIGLPPLAVYLARIKANIYKSMNNSKQ